MYKKEFNKAQRRVIEPPAQPIKNGNAQLAEFVDNRNPPGIIQKTAWEKTVGWVKKDPAENEWEKSMDGENTPPPANMGEVGYIYSSNRIKYYPNHAAYKNALFKTESAATSDEILVTDTSNEDSFLKGDAAAIVFHEDESHNYLLWSVPKYTGKNMMIPDVLDLADVSGEAQAEGKANAAPAGGYMMKQTMEHYEALSAIKMKLGDEGPIPSVAQYGVSGVYDSKKVDALHYPRDPAYQDQMIKFLKDVDDYFEKDPGKIIEAIPSRLKEEAQLYMGKTALEFKGWMYPKLDEIFAGIDRSKVVGTNDAAEEVTRAPLRDTNRRELLGGRQAVFDTIWGPKSDEVIAKSARRLDSVQSHGLKYHFNPKNTVQAKYEFPTYKKLLESTLGPRVKVFDDPELTGMYKLAIASVTQIIGHINIFEQAAEGTTIQDTGKKREAGIGEINRFGQQLQALMTQIRASIERKEKAKNPPM